MLFVRCRSEYSIMVYDIFWGGSAMVGVNMSPRTTAASTTTLARGSVSTHTTNCFTLFRSSNNGKQLNCLSFRVPRVPRALLPHTGGWHPACVAVMQTGHWSRLSRTRVLRYYCRQSTRRQLCTLPICVSCTRFRPLTLAPGVVQYTAVGVSSLISLVVFEVEQVPRGGPPRPRRTRYLFRPILPRHVVVGQYHGVSHPRLWEEDRMLPPLVMFIQPQ